MNDRPKGISLIVLGALLASPIGAVAAGMDHIGATEFMVLRAAGIVTFFGVAAFMTTGGGLVGALRASGLPGLLAAGALGTAIALSVYAFQNTTVARVLLMLSLTPLLAALLARIFLGERLAPVTILAIAISLVGVGLLVLGRPADETATTLRGDLASVALAVAYAIFVVAIRAGRQVNLNAAMMLAGLIGMALGVVFFWGTGETAVAAPSEMVTIFLVGIFCTGAAIYCLTIGAKYVASAEFTMISLSEIFFGSFWAWLFLSQGISLTTALGGALFFVAILLDARFGHPVETRS